MKQYYAKNKHRWKRTREQQDKINAQKRERYASDEKFRREAIEKSKDFRRRKPHMKKNAHLRSLYGITIEEFNRMALSQGGACAICNKVPVSGGPGGGLHVDHDHQTKAVRGLLCMNCNQGIGKFHDDTQVMLNAINYLKVHMHGTGRTKELAG